VAGVAERCRFLRADVTALDIPTGAVVHVDPSRRSGGRRAISWRDYSPGEEFLRSLPARTPAGAMKLSPAMDRRLLADGGNLELEYVSEFGVCKQLLPSQKCRSRFDLL